LTARALLLAAVILFCTAATPKTDIPHLKGHVVDAAHLLDDSSTSVIESRLQRFQRDTKYVMVVLVVAELGDESIEDLAYRAFNTWKIGDAKTDNGILLAIATNARKIRIETGKGAGGVLPDLRANDIIRETIAPPLKEGIPFFAVMGGIEDIERAVRGGPKPPPTPPFNFRKWIGKWWPVVFGAVFALGIALAVSPRLRRLLAPIGALLKLILAVVGYRDRKKDESVARGGKSGGGGSTDSY
jgi:uncharacterized protein